MHSTPPRRGACGYLFARGRQQEIGCHPTLDGGDLGAGSLAGRLGWAEMLLDLLGYLHQTLPHAVHVACPFNENHFLFPMYTFSIVRGAACVKNSYGIIPGHHSLRI